MITCNNCEELMQKYLCDLPYEWRYQISKVICKYLNKEESIKCSDVVKCETLTTLSAFTVNGDEVCIDYKDENGQISHRCFNMSDVGLNLNPRCIMSQEDWDALTWVQQIQAIIDYVCLCEPHFSEIPVYAYLKLGADVSTIDLLIQEYDISLTDATFIEDERWPTIGTPGIGSVFITYGDSYTDEYLQDVISVDLSSQTTFWTDINNWLLLNNFWPITFDGGLNKWLVDSPTNSAYLYLTGP